ncbi:MAG: DUF4245 domain-containing protein [Cryobacterium sp.]
MSREKRSPRVVAELGRPETPQETAERKAEGSRKYRSRKTINNLVFSLLATLVTVLVLVLLVPRNDTPILREVDFGTTVAQLQPSVDAPLANPELPDGWRANSAEWTPGTNDGISTWYIGLITAEKQFIGLTQGLGTNPTWLAGQVQNVAALDTRSIAGVQWDVHLNPATDPVGNFEYALVTTSGLSTYVLLGTADPDEFSVLAESLAPNIKDNARD